MVCPAHHRYRSLSYSLSFSFRLVRRNKGAMSADLSRSFQKTTALCNSVTGQLPFRRLTAAALLAPSIRICSPHPFFFRAQFRCGGAPTPTRPAHLLRGHACPPCLPAPIQSIATGPVAPPRFVVRGPRRPRRELLSPCEAEDFELCVCSPRTMIGHSAGSRVGTGVFRQFRVFSRLLSACLCSGRHLCDHTSQTMHSRSGPPGSRTAPTMPEAMPPGPLRAAPGAMFTPSDDGQPFALTETFLPSAARPARRSPIRLWRQWCRRPIRYARNCA